MSFLEKYILEYHCGFAGTECGINYTRTFFNIIFLPFRIIAVNYYETTNTNHKSP